MSHQTTMDEPVTAIFNLECKELQVWLALHQDGKPARLIPMWQRHAGFWSACVLVCPGEYGCRCYCGNDRIMVHCGAPEVSGGTQCGMDTLLSVNLVQRDALYIAMPSCSPIGTDASLSGAN